MIKAKADYDAIIIGAGPSGSVAAALLRAQGHRVHIIEKDHFPRFSIGESLLPQCMEFLGEANMLDAVHAAAEGCHFQFKHGASFVRRDQYTDFDFREKFSEGAGTTYQVLRGPFDQVLAQEVERQGVSISWGHTLIRFEPPADGGSGDLPRVTIRNEAGETYQLSAKFVLDASGFGRVLPRLLDLDRPSDFPSRTSLFTHIEDNMVASEFDRDKIRITIHHANKDVWFWLIPFANGRSSIGVVADNKFFAANTGDIKDQLQAIIKGEPTFTSLLRNAKYDSPAKQISGYASTVSSLYGPGYALLGNAGEFLDPVFSSGVTIAMKSASLAAATLHRQLQGEAVDWATDYAAPLQAGIDTFRVFVQAWYDGRFQDVIFAQQNANKKVRGMLSSILAGYAWDLDNPYVKDSKRRLNTLAELCKPGH
ncbi:MAG: FAD-dependent oxidoreductase [Cellvibrionales bacterium]|nr:MAG: FAD-dependent oxidoreductase [Cellvibrionales bacterium]